MAETKKYLHNLDVENNKVTNLLLNPLTTAQRTTIGGTLGLSDQSYVCYDTDLDQQYFWDGTQWITVGGGSVGPGTPTQIAFFDTTSSITSDTDLYWDNTNKRLAIGSNIPAYGLDVNKDVGIRGSTTTGGGQLGSELLTSSGWTSTDWTGSFAAGWTHTPGNTTSLLNSLAAVVNSYYVVNCIVSGDTSFAINYITFGGVTSNSVVGDGTYNFYLKATSTASLAFLPDLFFDGTVTLSVKLITQATSSNVIFKNSSNVTTNEIRISQQTANVFIGTSAGARHMSGSGNVFLGNNTGQNDLSGVDNVFIGSFTGTGNATGTQQVFIGSGAGNSMTVGNGTVIIGAYAGRFYGTGVTPLKSAINSIYLGSNTRASADGNTNEIVIGSDSGYVLGLGSNTTRIGSTNTISTYLAGRLLTGSTSDDLAYQLQLTNSQYFARFTTSAGTNTNAITFGKSTSSAIALHGSSGERKLLIGDGPTGYANIISYNSNIIQFSHSTALGGTLPTTLTLFSPDFIFSTGTNTHTINDVKPVINLTGGTNTLRGYYYHPNVISGSASPNTHIAFENTIGDIIHGNLATGGAAQMVTADSNGKLGIQAIPPAATFTSLTTTGSSGASTLSSGVLNVPTYTLSGLGGQPLATNLTSLSGLTYASASFVKMTAAGTFALDTNTYQTSLTFSTGLTNSSGTVTSNLSTGVSGGQSVVGGTAASNSLTLSSTTNATKGNILFGTSAYDEVNNRLGIQQTTPTSKLHINANQNSVTQDDANGILLANSTAAIAGTQSISPSLVWQGNGWQTGTSASQDVRFRADVLPVQGTTNPFATWTLASSINGASYINKYQISSAGTHTFFGFTGIPLLTLNNTGTITMGNGQISSLNSITASGQFKSGSATATAPYRTTNAGSDVTPRAFFGVPEVTAAGSLAYGINDTNGLAFTAANGTRQIARAGINIASLTNTAGAETGDLTFSTQSGGTAISEKMRIFGGGNVNIGNGATDAGFKLDVNGTARFVGEITGDRIGGTNIGASVQLQALAQSVGGTFTARTTNAAGSYNPTFITGSNAGTAGVTQMNYEQTNQLSFSATNASSLKVARAAIQITNLVNTAASESGDMIFLTQSGGTAMSEKMRITGAGGLTINATNTASGTTGNQTINKASGTVNIAAAGTTVTVTNSLVTASSIVYAVIRTNDATAVIKNVVPGAGSFVINLNAATTAETSIGFFVIN